MISFLQLYVPRVLYSSAGIAMRCGLNGREIMIRFMFGAKYYSLPDAVLHICIEQPASYQMIIECKASGY
jgi:hypothetical protein